MDYGGHLNNDIKPHHSGTVLQQLCVYNESDIEVLQLSITYNPATWGLSSLVPTPTIKAKDRLQ